MIFFSLCCCIEVFSVIQNSAFCLFFSFICFHWDRAISFMHFVHQPKCISYELCFVFSFFPFLHNHTHTHTHFFCSLCTASISFSVQFHLFILAVHSSVSGVLCALARSYIHWVSECFVAGLNWLNFLLFAIQINESVALLFPPILCVCCPFKITANE